MLFGILGEAGSGKDEAMRYLVEKHAFYSLALADPIKVYCGWMFDWDAERLYGPSKARNAPDERYTFLRCPRCGFTHPSLAPAPGFDVIHCPVCHANGVVGEWRTQLSSRYGLQSLGDWARNLFSEAYVRFALERAEIVQARKVLEDPLWHVLRGIGLDMDERWVGKLGDDVRHVVVSDVRLPNEIEGIQHAKGKVYRIQREAREDTTSTGIPNHNSEIAQRSVPDDALNGVIDNNGTFDELFQKLDDLVAIGIMSKD